MLYQWTIYIIIISWSCGTKSVVASHYMIVHTQPLPVTQCRLYMWLSQYDIIYVGVRNILRQAYAFYKAFYIAWVALYVYVHACKYMWFYCETALFQQENVCLRYVAQMKACIVSFKVYSCLGLASKRLWLFSPIHGPTHDHYLSELH